MSEKQEEREIEKQEVGEDGNKNEENDVEKNSNGKEAENQNETKDKVTGDASDDPLLAQLASKYNLSVDEKLEEIEKEEQQIERKEQIKRELEQSSGKAVDLSRVQLKYSTSVKPVFKSLLIEYGLPDEEQVEARKRERIRKRRRKRESESDTESTTQHTKTERSDRDKYRLSDYIKEEDYFENLGQKVAQQRKEIQIRSEDLERRLKQREQKLLPQPKKKPERHNLIHDSEYLHTIPKSNTYQVIKYENKLKSLGKLNRRSEVEDFWHYSKDHEFLKQYVKQQSAGVNKREANKTMFKDELENSFLSSRTSSLSSIDHEKEKTFGDFRPMTQIDETREPSRPSTRGGQTSQPWAVTQHFPSKHGPQKKTQDPYTIAKQAAIELDKKHPMMQLPQLSCFNDLIDDTVDPEQVLKQIEAERRDKERKLYVKRVRKMFHLAQANAAATKRIMEMREDFSVDDDNVPSVTWLSEFINAEECEKMSMNEEEKFFHARPWLRYVRNRGIVPIEEESEPPSQKTSAATTGRYRNRRSRHTSGASSAPSKHVEHMALGLPQLQETAKVVEPKCLSTLWTNYLSAGKSVFAK